MDISNISHPHRSEQVTLMVNDVSYDDISYYQWEEVLTNLTGDSDISYAIWVQDDELEVMEVSITYQDGVISSYKEEMV